MPLTAPNSPPARPSTPSWILHLYLFSFHPCHCGRCRRSHCVEVTRDPLLVDQAHGGKHESRQKSPTLELHLVTRHTTLISSIHSNTLTQNMFVKTFAPSARGRKFQAYTNVLAFVTLLQHRPCISTLATLIHSFVNCEAVLYYRGAG